MAPLRSTPLTEAHREAGARLVDFAGYAMPVQYGNILDEVVRVREHGGLFDLCHMGRCRIVGERRVEAAQFLVHVNVHKLKPGAIRYSFFAREDGTTIDDVLVYGDEDEVFFCINAGNRERDLAWMDEVARRHDCRVEDLSDELAMIAIQGPASVATVDPLADVDVDAIRYYGFVRGTIGGHPARISRTGYTGEDGYELYFPAHAGREVWDALLEAGEPHGVRPIGLGARDTLRLEAGMALYGHELDDTTNPVEAGIVVKPVKHPHDFSGRRAIEAVLETGPARRLSGLVTDGPRVPRQGYALYPPGRDEPVATVCSGSPSPTVGAHIGTAYYRTGHEVAGTTLEMDIRGVRQPVTVTALPFYKRPR